MRKLKISRIEVSLTFLFLLIVLAFFQNSTHQRTIEKALNDSNIARKVLTRLQTCQYLTMAMNVELRGYALTHEKKYVYLPYDFIKTWSDTCIYRIDSLLHIQNEFFTEGFSSLAEYKKTLFLTADHTDNLSKLIDQGKDSLFLVQFKDESMNKALADKWNKLTDIVRPFENRVIEDNLTRYEELNRINYAINLLLVALSLPAIIYAIVLLRKEISRRIKLLRDFHAYNQDLIFNDGQEITVANDEYIFGYYKKSINSLSDFIHAISSGNYTINYAGIDANNQEQNKNTLAAKIIDLRNKLRTSKENDAKINWQNEGLTSLSSIVRSNQNDVNLLSTDIVRFLTKYIGYQQGSIFIVHDDDPENIHLEMTACYAFDRKKYIQKIIKPGEGLAGQSYLERHSIVLTKLPEGYTQITSGLGDATPGCLCIVPMIHNGTIAAIVEVAGFATLAPHQLEFLEKCGEQVASAFLALKMINKMKTVLNQTTVDAL
ncbi:MAG TPA: GAF domain-containing protein [Ohtaekwangia sp.]|uniref:GAF domain-containing protein n=1 Tax=Ohtaekwangia sp. TaxID=2066019 RepID=UPI002F94A213